MLREFFYETLKNSMTISLLILLVFALTPMLNLRFRATWRLPVWIFLGISLCVPFSYLLSLGSLLFPEEAEVITEEFQHTVFLPPQEELISFEAFAEKSQPALGMQLSSIMPHWIFWLWITGLAIFGVILFAKQLYLRRKLQIHLTPADEKTDLRRDRKKTLPVYYHLHIPTAFLVGCINPIIVLPGGEASPELQTILQDHEYMHFHRKDLWIKLFFQIVLLLYWYNPIVHWMVREVHVDIELCCDASLIRKYGKDFVNPYADAILQTLKNSSKLHGYFALGWHNQGDIIKKRLSNIYDKKSKKGLSILFTIFLFPFLSGIYLYGASQEIPIDSLPGYQTLIDQAIANHEVILAAEEAKYAGKQRYILLTKEMMEDPAYLNPDGTLDEERLTRDQAVLQNAVYEPLLQPWEDTIYQYNACNGIIEPHVAESGKISLYSNEKGKKWSLKRGQTVNFEILLDNQYYGSDGRLYIGYIMDDIDEEISIQSIDQDLELAFSVPENGDYQFYIWCTDFEPILINWIKISIT